METKDLKNKQEKDSTLNFGDLEFEEVLTDLLKIKSVENTDLKKKTPKKEKTPTSKK